MLLPFGRQQTGQTRSIIVLSDGQLVGLLTLGNVQEFALIQAALEKNVSGDKIEVIRTTQNVVRET
jgi:hypothetical protein